MSAVALVCGWVALVCSVWSIACVALAVRKGDSAKAAVEEELVLKWAAVAALMWIAAR